MNLVFIGPPGSGKGTQADRLSKQFGVVHLSTGDVLRGAVQRQSGLGKKVEEIMKTGELIPDELIIGIIGNIIKRGELSKGFILDGFPRTIPQADSLETLLEGNGLTLDAVVLFNVSNREIANRISGRRFCPKCSAGYNINMESQKPENLGLCDKDGEELKQRADDSVEVVLNRLEVYKKQTEPIVQYYRELSMLVEVEAELTPDEVFEDLKKKVNV